MITIHGIEDTSIRDDKMIMEYDMATSRMSAEYDDTGKLVMGGWQQFYQFNLHAFLFDVSVLVGHILVARTRLFPRGRLVKVRYIPSNHNISHVVNNDQEWWTDIDTRQHFIDSMRYGIKQNVSKYL